MMAAREALGQPRTVLFVADDLVARDATRAAVLQLGHYVLVCKVDDLGSLVRSFQIDALVVMAERTGLLVAKLREAIAGARIAARHIAIVATADEARSALVRACEPE
jgi:hypothetical protein